MECTDKEEDNCTDFSGVLSFLHITVIISTSGLQQHPGSVVMDQGPLVPGATQNKLKELNKKGFSCPRVCNGDESASLCI